MAKKLKVGDEVMIRAEVSAIWPNGEITILIKSAGQKVTLPNDSDIVEKKEER